MADQSSLQLDTDWQQIENFPDTLPKLEIDPTQTVYIMYTSGSTGSPKGVVISHLALANYLIWAKSAYMTKDSTKHQLSFPLFTLISFDLTVTSIFLPLITGGQVVIYPEGPHGPDLSILQVVQEDLVNAIKLTPSHLALLSGKNLRSSKIELLVVGGENLKSATAAEANSIFGKDVKLFNEYGPTEATVGCIFHQFSSEDIQLPSIPIGKPITNMQAYILDNSNNPVPKGVTGTLFLSGAGLLDGYLNQPDYTSSKLVNNPFIQGGKMYNTGDLVRMDHENRLIYLGRIDEQVQIGGIRVELGEIEAVLNQFTGISNSVADLQFRLVPPAQQEIQNCVSCGLPSNYPSVGFDMHGVCDLCLSFENYQQKARKYFRHLKDLKSIFESASSQKGGQYDCIMLLSGGKDSTYALARLVEMDLKVLAFTLDNGYISDEAKANIKRVVGTLGVDHVFGETKAMNSIFVNSLKQHANECNGCFKTIYTLSTKLAIEKQIPVIVTGLSRGQFFETRLTEELFRKPDIDFDRIDQTILEARKVYHRADDAINRLLDASFFKNDKVFEQIQFVDFYRYCDVSLSELFSYLDQKLPWVRPSDTGRSTNCLINQAGIYVHKKLHGYSNYAFPYSWDVRLGHKTRDASLEEINEVIEEQEVHRMLDEIGFTLENTSPERQQLVAYYVGDAGLSEAELKEHLAKALPDYMVPSQIHAIKEIPLSPGGKIDRKSLPQWDQQVSKSRVTTRIPETQVEKMLHEIWSEVLQTPQLGIDDNFLNVGGNSLQAIRVMARVNENFGLDLTLTSIFEYPTISSFGNFVEKTIDQLLDQG
jgi:amino acid adenylation domain-containing protein